MRVWQNGWRRELLEPPQISNVTDLDMRESMIGSKHLDQFLRSFPHLQSFVYTSFCEGSPDGNEFDPFVIRAALQARVSTTLRKLTILANAVEDEKTFMGPLCGFKVLEYVHRRSFVMAFIQDCSSGVTKWDCLYVSIHESLQGTWDYENISWCFIHTTALGTVPLMTSVTKTAVSISLHVFGLIGHQVFNLSDSASASWSPPLGFQSLSPYRLQEPFMLP